ncbi:MAG: aldose 1-epimerase family protein [Thermoguttaceae bacterium]|jgi:hypothetical protein|nr:aldose 1-epimerase family protein [Thermoguttaceae bacterium]
MPRKTWTLADQQQDIYVDQIAIEPENVGGQASGYSVTKRVLSAGVRRGVEVVEVNNGRLRFTVVPTRGMGIWRASLGQLQLGWNSPVKGPVHPSMVRLNDPSGIGWLDGFDELLVRCGLESNGAPEFNDQGALVYGLHGKIANIPAHQLEVSIDGDEGEISVRGVVDEARLFGNNLRLESTITTRVGEASFTVTDVVSNISAEENDLELLYHVNFGVPLLEPGAKAVVPVRKLAPRDVVAKGNLPQWDTYGPPTPGLAEACFFFELCADADGNTEAVLHNEAGSQGVAMRHNTQQLPYFILWKNMQAQQDGYVTGLEPAINFPNRKSFEKQHGRVAELKPGEQRTFQLTLEALPDEAAVAAATARVAQLQNGTTPQILDRPDPQWSAG